MGLAFRQGKSIITCSVSFSFIFPIAMLMDIRWISPLLTSPKPHIHVTLTSGLLIREFEFLGISKPILYYGLFLTWLADRHLLKLKTELPSNLESLRMYLKGVFWVHFSFIYLLLISNHIRHIRKTNFLSYADDIKLFHRV